MSDSNSTAILAEQQAGYANLLSDCESYEVRIDFGGTAEDSREDSPHFASF